MAKILTVVPMGGIWANQIMIQAVAEAMNFSGAPSAECATRSTIGDMHYVATFITVK